MPLGVVDGSIFLFFLMLYLFRSLRPVFLFPISIIADWNGVVWFSCGYLVKRFILFMRKIRYFSCGRIVGVRVFRGYVFDG
jgi:hypothetical protein